MGDPSIPENSVNYHTEDEFIIDSNDNIDLSSTIQGLDCGHTSATNNSDCHHGHDVTYGNMGSEGNGAAGGVFASTMFVTGLAILVVTMFLIGYIRFMFVVLGWKRKRVVVPMPPPPSTQPRRQQQRQRQSHRDQRHVSAQDTTNEDRVEGDEELDNQLDHNNNEGTLSGRSTPYPLLEVVVE